MKLIKRFLWLCSGSNLALLKQCPTETSRYASIGATVLFTGLFAAFASSYAIYTFTANYWWSAIMGCLWGLMIFNFDRYIVSSMRKSSRTRHDLKLAIPRVILAILISLIIAKPLELKIFEKEVATELIDMNRAIHQARVDKITQKYSMLEATLTMEKQMLQKELMDKSGLRDSLVRIAQQEADGTGGSMRRNAGPIYRLKRNDAETLDKELQALRLINLPLIQQKNEEIQELRRKRDIEINALPRSGYSGLAARLEAVHNLVTKSSTLWWANFFIILLFIALETAPVLVKLISDKGPYDYLLAEKEHQFVRRWILYKARSDHSLRKKASGLGPEENAFISNQLSSPPS